MIIECAADPSQQRQCDQIPQTCCNRCGHIVWVDPHLFRSNNYANHHQTCENIIR